MRDLTASEIKTLAYTMADPPGQKETHSPAAWWGRIQQSMPNRAEDILRIQLDAAVAVRASGAPPKAVILAQREDVIQARAAAAIEKMRLMMI